MNTKSKTITLPDSVIELLEEEPRRRGLPIEYIIIEKVMNNTSSLDRASAYERLCDKYLKEAEELEKKDDLVQASEKLWSAVATCIAAIAELRGWEHYKHRHLAEIIERLAHEENDPELADLFANAERLHANFYHNFLRKATYNIYAKKVGN